MPFGDNTAARARKAELIQEQADSMTTVQAPSGAMYRVYRDLPPGVGWVVRRIGALCPKWYLANKELALLSVVRHDFMHTAAPEIKPPEYVVTSL